MFGWSHALASRQGRKVSVITNRSARSVLGAEQLTIEKRSSSKTGLMPDEHTLTLAKRTKPISDFAAIGDELDFIKAQLARIPTRKELAQKRCLQT